MMWASDQGVDAMSLNPIQFQQGMSLPEFLRCFGTEAACAEAVRRARWPDGFSCPRCGGCAHCVIVSGVRSLFQCHACHRQTSLTAGTLFGSTKLPLTTWFLAIYLISQAKAVCPGAEASRRRELPDGLVDAPQTHDGDGRARGSAPPVGLRAGR